MTKLPHTIHLARFCSVALISALLILPLPLMAQDKTAEKEEVDITVDPKLTVELEDKSTDFEYRIEGRPDPFVPFLRPQVKKQVRSDEEINPTDMLTGMQLFEPGQLSLVGIMGMEDGYIALVEDSTGKGYVIKEGMKIGRRGVITEIATNIVRITETRKFRSGKEVKSTIDMVLKKEGEE